MLFEYTTLILMQGYVALYLITNFEVSQWDVLKQALTRISIGFGIEFFFNSLTILVQNRWYSIPISDVWAKHWKLHILANALATAMMVLYFTEFLLNVIQGRTRADRERLVIQNCSTPFSSL